MFLTLPFLLKSVEFSSQLARAFAKMTLHKGPDWDESVFNQFEQHHLGPSYDLFFTLYFQFGANDQSIYCRTKEIAIAKEKHVMCICMASSVR